VVDVNCKPFIKPRNYMNQICPKKGGKSINKEFTRASRGATIMHPLTRNTTPCFA